MASNKNKQAVTAASGGNAGVDMAALSKIAAGTLGYVSQDIGQPLVAAGFITVNANDSDGQNAIKATMTEAGIKALSDADLASSPTDIAPATAKFKFEIVRGHVPTFPDKAKRAARGGSAYPFDELTVFPADGSSFFIPVTTDKPEPWKSHSSLIAQAKKKYATLMTDDAGKPVMETFKSRKTGAEASRQKMSYARDFSLRAAPDGDKMGKGAYFTRIK